MMKKIQVPQQYFELLVGRMDENLKAIEKYIDGRVSARGNEVFIDGGEAVVQEADLLVQKLLSLLQNGYNVTPGDIKTSIGLLKQNPDLDLSQFFLNNRIIPSTKKNV